MRPYHERPRTAGVQESTPTSLEVVVVDDEEEEQKEDQKRVHAVQNHGLSNEQFTRKGVHSMCALRDQQHRENTEHMAADLITFLGKSEWQKYEDVAQYKPIKNDLWKEVATLWGLNEDFTGTYRENCQVL